MNATNACSKCGDRVPSDAPLGLCPKCLMSAATSATANEPPVKTPNPPAAIGRAELLRVVRELNLIPAEELDRIAGTPDAGASPPAQVWVREKRLTPYQAGALLAGKARGLVIGPYLVEDKLGSGGMGLVLKARHRPSDRVVALKMLPPSFGRDADVVRRFRREFQIAGRLNHPNLVAAIEAGEDRGIHYLTMEYIPGYDLDLLVSRGGPMALTLALHCAIQVARGLEAAHAQGIIHRDVKPGNVMIDPNGSVRVLDLGLARVIEATAGFSNQSGTLTQTGSYMGTIDFLAPEQADNAKTADVRADIYSLACTLYFLLTARPPFSGETVLKRLMAHQERPAPSLRAVRPEVSEALDAVYLKMMAKRPADRPQSMSEVVIALEACRTSVREAGDVSVDLKTFARTIMKRAPERKPRGTEASVFARHANPPDGLGLGHDLNLEDLMTDYRPEAGHNPIPEDKLPPIVSRPLPHHPRRRRHPAAPYAIFGCGLIVVAGAAFALWPKSVPPATPTQSQTTSSGPVDPLDLNPASAAAVSSPAVKPAIAVAEPPAAKVLLSEEFTVPNTAWIQSDPEEIARNPGNAHGMENGAWYCTSSGYGESSWDVPGGRYPEMELDLTLRVLGTGNADPRGGALIHVLADVQGVKIDTDARDFKTARGFQVRLNGAGQLMLEPSFFTAKAYPNGPWKAISHPALKPGGQTNVLKLRITKRQLAIFANGVQVTDPIAFDWDLSPALLEFGADSWSGTVRAEFDKVEIRELLPTPTVGEAFRPLFNGKDLTGWAGNVGDFEVTDGILSCKPGLRGVIYEPVERGDFAARVEFRLAPGAESGLLLRSPGKGEYFEVAVGGMCEIQILDDTHPSYGTLDPRYHNGSAYGLAAAERGHLKPVGEWNVQEVVVRGSTVEVTLNGAQILKTDLATIHEFAEGKPHPGKDRLRGFFAIQSGFGKREGNVQYRKIEIRELSAPPAPAEPQQNRVLFVDDFSNTSSNMAETDPEVMARGIPDDAHGYGNGVWYCTARDGADYSWTTGLKQKLPDFEIQASVRVVGDADRSRGSAVIHVFSGDEYIIDKAARAFQIRIDGFGRLFVEPSFWSAQRFPQGPWKGPITNPVIRPGGGEFNQWTIRVHKRLVEILVNGTAVCAPLEFDWDLVPAGINLGVDSEDGIVRAEFDKVEIRALPPMQAPPPKPPGAALAAALDRRIDLNFRKAPLEDVIKFFQALTVSPDLPQGVPISVDNAGLRKARQSKLSPVTITARSTPLKDGLRSVLKPLRLKYVVRDDGTIVITSR